METPTPFELRRLCDLLCDKSCALAETVEKASPLADWRARGCMTALQELHTKMDLMLEIVARQQKVQVG